MKKGMVGGYIFERSRKMAISKDNVKSNFMELSGLDSTSAEVYAGLITVCADEMEKAVDQERMVAEGGRLYANLRRQRRSFTDLFV